jgi:hypothetical protein
MQPCQGIAWWAHRDDDRQRGNQFLALLSNPIGSKDPDALKIPARRAEYSLTESASSPVQAEPRHHHKTKSLKKLSNYGEKPVISFLPALAFGQFYVLIRSEKRNVIHDKPNRCLTRHKTPEPLQKNGEAQTGSCEKRQVDPCPSKPGQ